MTAMQELVVPKSMPKTFAIKININWLSVACSYAIPMPQLKKWTEVLQTKGWISFFSVLKSTEIAPKAPHWHTDSAIWHKMIRRDEFHESHKTGVRGDQIFASRRERLSRDGFSSAFASTVVQVNQLIGLADVTDDVELADQFLFRGVKGGSGIPEAFAIGGLF
jgi:hypothetical protein